MRIAFDAAVIDAQQNVARFNAGLFRRTIRENAAHAHAHYVATKQTRAGRTISEIALLEPDERVTELARMLGGQSEAARQHAEALLGV